MAAEIIPITKLAFLREDYLSLERLKHHEINSLGLIPYLWKRITHLSLYAEKLPETPNHPQKHNSLEDTMEKLPSA